MTTRFAGLRVPSHARNETTTMASRPSPISRPTPLSSVLVLAPRSSTWLSPTPCAFAETLRGVCVALVGVTFHWNTVGALAASGRVWGSIGVMV